MATKQELQAGLGALSQKLAELKTEIDAVIARLEAGQDLSQEVAAVAAAVTEVQAVIDTAKAK